MLDLRWRVILYMNEDVSWGNNSGSQSQMRVVCRSFVGELFDLWKHQTRSSILPASVRLSKFHCRCTWMLDLRWTVMLYVNEYAIAAAFKLRYVLCVARRGSGLSCWRSKPTFRKNVCFHITSWQWCTQKCINLVSRLQMRCLLNTIEEWYINECPGCSVVGKFYRYSSSKVY